MLTEINSMAPYQKKNINMTTHSLAINNKNLQKDVFSRNLNEQKSQFFKNQAKTRFDKKQNACDMSINNVIWKDKDESVCISNEEAEEVFFSDQCSSGKLFTEFEENLKDSLITVQIEKIATYEDIHSLSKELMSTTQDENLTNEIQLAMSSLTMVPIVSENYENIDDGNNILPTLYRNVITESDTITNSEYIKKNDGLLQAQDQNKTQINFLSSQDIAKYVNQTEKVTTVQVASINNEQTIPNNNLELKPELSKPAPDSVIFLHDKEEINKIPISGKSSDFLQEQASAETDWSFNSLIKLNDSSNSNVEFKPEIPEPKKIIEQIVKQMELTQKKETSELTIHLKPEYLGKMIIKLSFEEGSIIARFMTESHNVKNILDANMQMLKRTLENNGIRVEKTEVNVQISDNSSFSQQQSSNSRQGENQRWGNEYFQYQNHHATDEIVPERYDSYIIPIESEGEASLYSNSMNYLV